jgi:hypothetical protein
MASNGRDDFSYLVDAYVRASDAWDRFAETGSRKHLREAGAILCQALERFAGDDEIWTRAAHALDNARDGGSQEQVKALLEDTEAFINLESEVLSQFAPGAERRRRLVVDALVAHQILGTTPTGPALQNLRSRVRGLAELQCATVQDQKNGRFWKKAVANTWRGLKAVGGGALIGANLIAPIDPISKAGSVMGGAGLIESAARD